MSKRGGKASRDAKHAKAARPSDRLTTKVEELMSVLFGMLIAQLIAVEPQNQSSSKLSALRMKLRGYDAQGRAIAADELREFGAIAGTKGFRTAHGFMIAPAGHRSDKIEYLVASPVWDKEAL